MNRAHDELVELGVVSDKSHSFAVALRHEKGQRAPICGLRTRHYDARSDMFRDLSISGLLKVKGNSTGC